ncbi:MAG: glycosyltransferase family 4 protein, partial [Candidatus Aminicenantes bacterium]|nr:glycosyltransferase family 4 protein [Candidatus Aminicenantes bacterium]
ADNTYFLYVTESQHPFFREWKLPPHVVLREIPVRNPLLRISSFLAGMSRRDRLDILHVQYIAPPLHGGRLVATIHDLGFLHFPHTFSTLFNIRSRLLVRRTALRARQIITGSAFSRSDLLRTYGLPAEKVAVIPHGVGPAFSQRASEEEIRRVAGRYGIRRPYILCVARLNPRKNLTTLALAFAALKTSPGIPHSLVLAGRKDYDSARVIRSVAQASQGDVVFTGFVRDEDLPVLYQGADVFVYPSLFEGVGLPVLEAMAAGVPVITSRTSSLAETAGDAALTTDPLHADKLAAALRRMIGDPKLRRRFREKGIARAAAFTWEETARRTLDVYRAVAAGGRPEEDFFAATANSMSPRRKTRKRP